MLAYANKPGLDLVSNVQVRTFPKGHSAEMLNAATFSRIVPSELSEHEREHLTAVYYRHPERFSIINIESSEREAAMQSFAVDTLQDLQRLEEILRREKRSSSKAPVHA
jgi:spore coat polysaccharide biosynthesis protein SpsF